MRYLIALLLATLTASAATNMVPNGSFELGTTKGWIAYGSADNAYGNISSVKGLLVTTNSVHGSNSMQFYPRLYSRFMHLTNGQYVLTFSGLCLEGAMTMFWAVYSPPEETQTPGNGMVIDTTWKRFTNSVNITSNGWYTIKFYHAQDTKHPMVDAVQLEPGGTASAFYPRNTIEVGIGTTDEDDILMGGDTKQFQLAFWNEGASASARVEYKGYDWSHSNYVSGVVSTNALVNGYTAINVPITGNGWQLFRSYMTNYYDSWDEKVVSVLPFSASTLQNTNGLLGTHPPYGVYGVKRDRQMGAVIASDLSPARCVRWGDIETSRGVFSWKDYCVVGLSTNGMIPLLVLVPQQGSTDGTWVSWAVDGGGNANILDYSNYCYAVAARYSPAPSNCFIYEIGNEWHNFVTPTDFTIASNQARFQVAGAQAVRAANANAWIIGFAGENDPARAYRVWTNMTAGEQGLFNALSCHLYPLDAGSVDPNNTFDDRSLTASSYWWAATNNQTFNKPIWNTESGSATYDGLLGDNAMWGVYRAWGATTPEASRDWLLGQRKIARMDNLSQQFLRTVGNGQKHYIHYYSKERNDDTFLLNFNPSTLEWSGAVTCDASAATIAANYMCQTSGLGRITNTSSGFIEAYLFTNTTHNAVVALWTYDRAERTLTLTNASGEIIALFDPMANMVYSNFSGGATFRIGRSVEYVVSTVLNPTALSQTIANASVASVTDLAGPNTSVDSSPIGLINSNQTHFFKWTSQDRNKLVWTIGSFGNDNTNLLYKWRFSGTDSYNTYSQSNHAFATFTQPGTYALDVVAKDFYNNESTVVGPTFYIEGASTNPPAPIPRLKLKVRGRK